MTEKAKSTFPKRWQCAAAGPCQVKVRLRRGKLGEITIDPREYIEQDDRKDNDQFNLGYDSEGQAR